MICKKQYYYSSTVFTRKLTIILDLDWPVMTGPLDKLFKTNVVQIYRYGGMATG